MFHSTKTCIQCAIKMCIYLSLYTVYSVLLSNAYSTLYHQYDQIWLERAYVK